MPYQLSIVQKNLTGAELCCVLHGATQAMQPCPAYNAMRARPTWGCMLTTVECCLGLHAERLRVLPGLPSKCCRVLPELVLSAAAAALQHTVRAGAAREHSWRQGRHEALLHEGEQHHQLSQQGLCCGPRAEASADSDRLPGVHALGCTHLS